MSGKDRLFVFDTTHHALWAEDVAREREIAAEVVPAPAESGAKCDLALRTFPTLIPTLEGALLEEGVPHRLYP
ncbi:MAG: DUF3343 domain-containing protein [Gemmatimonadetes bacterium]|nr:DUF3343 domain-containing protein [Gemmatimonadota bacterium]